MLSPHMDGQLEYRICLLHVYSADFKYKHLSSMFSCVHVYIAYCCHYYLTDLLPVGSTGPTGLPGSVAGEGEKK